MNIFSSPLRGVATQTIVALAAATMVWAYAPAPSLAHDLSVAKAAMQFDEDGAAWRITLETDVMAVAGGAQPGHLEAAEAERLRGIPGAEQEALLELVRELMTAQTALHFDGGAAARPESVTLPRTGDVFAQSALAAQIRGRAIVLTGTAPPDARHVTLQFPELIGPVSLTVSPPGADADAAKDAAGDEAAESAAQNQLLQPGAASAPFALRGDGAGNDDAAVARAPLGRTVGQYLLLGFTHILPYGLDHILFVLGLFLLSARWKPLLWQVTAFTVAHTLTLALAITGVVSAPSSVVEPLIALSIAFVAVENIATDKLKPWRPAVVFAFGLLHGLGFAGVLEELGLPAGQLAAALVSFNVGVELGQLAVISLAFLVVGWFHARAWYRPRVVVPVSALIAAVGLYWTVERVFF